VTKTPDANPQKKPGRRPGEKQDAVVSVDARDQSGAIVVHADIIMYVSPRSWRLY